ncbi:MAG TPA: MOSC domain-containing protein [Pyrinomonadaceae bacterium]|nr:MOSC domain-containing protein [Pyrinomonadaceae bacterium]
MPNGSVVSICVAGAKGKPMTTVDEARAVVGKGLEGDRYFKGTGTFWKKEPDRELTLIEIEAVEEFERNSGIAMNPADGRRNVVTRGVSLNDLVGREFLVGGVRLRGLRLCEPCSHLARLTGHREIIRGMAHRGGLRAQILTDGVIRVGDEVKA